MKKYTWGERFAIIWAMLWNGYIPGHLERIVMKPDQLTKRLSAVLGDPQTQCVQRAFEKMKNEVHFPGRFHLYTEGAGEVKRKEVLQWAEIFCTQQGLPVDHWHLNFVLEFFVGKDKGLF